MKSFKQYLEDVDLSITDDKINIKAEVRDNKKDFDISKKEYDSLTVNGFLSMLEEKLGLVKGFLLNKAPRMGGLVGNDLLKDQIEINNKIEFTTENPKDTISFTIIKPNTKIK